MRMIGVVLTPLSASMNLWAFVTVLLGDEGYNIPAAFGEI
jgi:hypothetical protein